VIDEVVAYRAEIYQASGIVAVQLGIGADDALLRLGAHAFAQDTPLDVVASAIVHRRLRLDDNTPPHGLQPNGMAT
jgi:AmiR/NasT family two-component response regulator